MEEQLCKNGPEHQCPQHTRSAGTVAETRAMPRAALLAMLAMTSASDNTPQARVLCTGVHVLCSLASCELASDESATCSCVVVNDTYAVAVSEIANDTLARATSEACTDEAPCATDAAPVCAAIQDGGVFGGRATAPGMVSTFSWGGWCAATKYDPERPSLCPASPWAGCMTSPCWEEQAGETTGAVRCECPWQNSSWIDLSGDGCDAIVSTVPADFDMRVMPGAEYVLGACDELW